MLPLLSPLLTSTLMECSGRSSSLALAARKHRAAVEWERNYWDLGGCTQICSVKCIFLCLQCCIFSKLLSVPLDFKAQVCVSSGPCLPTSLSSDQRYFHLFLRCLSFRFCPMALTRCMDIISQPWGYTLTIGIWALSWAWRAPVPFYIFIFPFLVLLELIHCPIITQFTKSHSSAKSTTWSFWHFHVILIKC